MNWRLHEKQTENGFSIVELMVTVAIGGAIVAMAVPSYCKYSSSAKQAQAKNLLGAIWVAEQSAAIETQSYTGCLADIGVSATAGSPLLYYGFGFNFNQVSSTTCGPNGGQPCLTTNWSTLAPCTLGNGSNEVAFQAAANMNTANHQLPGAPQLNPQPAAGWITNTSFVAMAAGNISSCNSAYDKWTIDQTKTITNIAPAL